MAQAERAGCQEGGRAVGRGALGAVALAVAALVAALAAAIAATALRRQAGHQRAKNAASPLADAALAGGPCTVVQATDLSCAEFVDRFLGREPVVIRAAGGHAALRNAAFVQRSGEDNVRREAGHLPVKLSTANAFTGREWTEMTLSEYMAHTLGPQAAEKQGNQTFYLFGSQHGPAWDEFLQPYVPPTHVYPSESFLDGASVTEEIAKQALCEPGLLADKSKDGVSLSFGIAGRGTGVPFHFHGPGFLQQLHGRKRWMLYPPGSKPRYHPNETTLHWIVNEYPDLVAAGEGPTHECVLEPLDVIYFPRDWMHATLNLDNYTCFMASFA